MSNTKLLQVLLLLTGFGITSGTQCGSVFNAPTERFNISSNASTYKAPCDFTIRAQKVAVAMYFRIEVMDLRNNDSLAVYNGSPKNTSAFISVDQSLPSDTPVVFYSSGTTDITLVWNSSTTSKSSFYIDVSPNNCSYQFSTASSVIVSSPVYEPAQNGSMNCQYTLNYGTSGDKEMVLSFDKVNLAKGTLKLSNGQTFTDGTTTIGDQILQEGSVTMNFTLSTARPDNGFTAVAAGFTPECTNEITLNNMSVFELKSPNYPGSYENNLLCRWVIHSTGAPRLWLAVEDFVMGDNSDHVMLKDGDSHASPFMGDFSNTAQPESSLLTTGKSLWIQFTTDQSMVAKGFRMLIRPVVYGGAYRNSGTIVLKKLQNQTVSTKIDDQIYIQLLTDPLKQLVAEFNVTDGVMLPSSSIMCYEGLAAVPEKAITTLTSSTQFYPVFTEGTEMLIVISGYLKNNTFLASQSLNVTFNSRVQDYTRQYSAGVSGSYAITKEQVYTSAEGATWIIHSPKGEATWLKIATLKVMPEYEVNVYDGPVATGVKVGHFLSSLPTIPVMYLPNGARVEYRMINNSVTSRPSRANNDVDNTPVLTAAYSNTPACVEMFNVSSGVIASPLYPDRYPYNSYCVWMIDIPANKSLHLAFTDFQLAAGHSVELRKVEQNTTTTIVEYSSESMPSDLITTGSELWVVFSAASNASYDVSKGFRIEFEVIDCGGNVNSAGQAIATPGYPAATKGNLTCVWIVTLLPPQKAVDKNSVSFNYAIKGIAKNDTTMLEVNDGNSSQSESFDIPTKESPSGDYLSRYNQIYVAYRFQVAPADINNTGFAFQLTFKSYECNMSAQCGSGICLHPDWRCNGMDDCGDMTDERNCTAGPAHNTVTKTGIKPWAVALAVIITFFATVLLTIFVPRCYQRIKNRRYGTLHEVLSPVET